MEVKARRGLEVVSADAVPVLQDFELAVPVLGAERAPPGCSHCPREGRPEE